MMDGDKQLAKDFNLDDWDAPQFVDFTNFNPDEVDLSDEEWFARRRQTGLPSAAGGWQDQDEDDLLELDCEDDGRPACPSPKKKQRIGHQQKPRRSPRLASPSFKQPSAPKVAMQKKYKSTEEMELEMIEARKRDLARARRAHEAAYKKALVQKPVALKSSQPPTIPQGFHFQSDQRIRGDGGENTDTSVKDFARTLRSALPNIGAKCKSITRPKPFNLTQAKSVGCLPATQKYTTAAEEVSMFKDGFRSSTRNKGAPSSNRTRPQSPCLTIPKTPTLSSRGRSRSYKHLTRDEEEKQEYELHKKQQFKAHPVNRKVLNEPQGGVPKIPPRPLTAVKEFNLHSSNTLPRKLPSEEDKHEFHAQRVNSKILEGPTGIKPAEKRPITVPESPAFALRGRLRSREHLHQEAPPAPAPKVVTNPVPHSGVPFKPQLEHKCTIAKPFAVEQHSKEMLKKKEQKIQQVLEEEKRAREFHASLLPSDSPDTLPPKKTRPVTKPVPFDLDADDRGKKYREAFMSKIEEEEAKARAMASFLASDSKVLSKAPFVPEKSHRPLTEMSSFSLNTDQRAVKREEFNQHLKAHEARLEAVKRQQEERREKEENQAVAQMRQQTVHKAKGVQKYKAVSVQASDKPLTQAESPHLRTQRLRARNVSE